MINTLSAGKDNFYRQMLKLTIPIIIQNLLSAAVNSADVIMLNYVGQSAISAVSLAANYSNILFMVYYGLGTGASLLCAQYFGKNNMQAIHAIEGIALRFSIIISGIVALIAFTAPQLMMKIFTSDQELISIGSSYLRIMGNYISLLGNYRGLSGDFAQHRTRNDQYGIEYAGFYIEYYPECYFYLRAFRRTEAGGYRCCHCNCCFQTDRTGSMRDCFFPEQRC